MKRFIVTIILIASASYVFADDSINANAGTYGAQYLKIDPSAKAASMGESYTAIADSPFGIFWNPAGTYGTQKIDIGVMHNSWISGISQDVALVSLPLGEGKTFTVGTVMTNMPRIEGSDVYGNDNGSYVAYNMILAASYSTSLFRQDLSAGLTYKYLQEAIENEKATGNCFDLGVKYAPDDKKYSLGASLQNIGQSMVFVQDSFPLPLTYRIGGAYKLLDDKLQCVSDIWKSVDDDLKYGIGLDYSLSKMINVRAGMLSDGNFTLGFGVKYNIMIFDYGFVPYEYFGYTHRLSLRLLFDMPEREKKVTTASLKSIIFGRIVDKNGIAPVSLANIRVIQAGRDVAKATADTNGNYVTPQLPYGDYMIKAGKALYLPIVKPFRLDKWAESPQLDFQLESVKLYTLYGNVSDKNQKPLPDITLRISKEGKEVFRVLTDLNGNFITPELPKGVYIVTPVLKDEALTSSKKCKLMDKHPIRCDFILDAAPAIR